MSRTVESARQRLFVALPVPEAVKASIAEAQQCLRRAVPAAPVRWTRPEQFHLTLRFLGDVAVHQTNALVEALRSACRGLGSLHLSAAGLGFFPKPRAPRVVWVGVTENQDRLAGLWTSVQLATSSFTSEAPEATFTGHITLARIKSIRPEEAEALAAAAKAASATVFGEWKTKELDLMASELSPQGARHTTLAAVPL